MVKSGIAVIGGGNMGAAIIEGLIAKNTSPASVLVIEVSQQRRREIGERFRVRTAAGVESGVSEAKTIILAVKPQSVKEILKALSPHLSKEQLLISVAAGISIAFIEKRIGVQVPVVRSMPNIAAKVGMSAVAMCAGGAVTPEQRGEAKKVLESIGTVIEVDENQIDAVTGLSGSGPAFVFLMVEALSDGGVLAGLPREKAAELALLTLEGSASLLRKLKIHPAAAREMVASPGGTTIEGLFSLEEGGFKGLVMKAVKQAAEKSRRMGAQADE